MGLAARLGVGLDTVLRRYAAVHVVFHDFIAQEASLLPGGRPEVARDAARSAAALLDRLIEGATDAYASEAPGWTVGDPERRRRSVRGLLAGELIDTDRLDYDLDAWHLGIVARGPGALPVVRRLSRAAHLRLLLVPVDRQHAWVWLARSTDFRELDILDHLPSDPRSGFSLAFGEVCEGLDGWRLTHRQASRALPIALQRRTLTVRYKDVALLATALHDEVLAESLQRAYLAPLADEPDGGRSLREVLRAYLAAGRNARAASAALGVSRQTVAKRLAVAERKIGRCLTVHAAEIETALRLPAGFPPD